jgi:diguanylate cyclase (GGDEF)-like protein
VHAIVAEEAARLLGAPGAAVLRTSEGAAEVVGAWDGRDGAGCSSIPAGPSPEAIAEAVLGGAPGAVAPVRAAGRPWGLLAVARFPGLAPDADRRLRELGEVLGLAVAHLDARERLATLALTDSLTGLSNRRAFRAGLEAEVERARRRREPLALAALDCDHLKAVNDGGGHEAGDALLAELAAAMRDVARGQDHLARTGGDEFAWLLPDTGADAAARAVQRLRERLGGRASVSVGISELAEGDEPEELLRRADRALYLAKEGGRGVTRQVLRR